MWQTVAIELAYTIALDILADGLLQPVAESDYYKNSRLQRLDEDTFDAMILLETFYENSLMKQGWSDDFSSLDEDTKLYFIERLGEKLRESGFAEIDMNSKDGAYFIKSMRAYEVAGKIKNDSIQRQNSKEDNMLLHADMIRKAMLEDENNIERDILTPVHDEELEVDEEEEDSRVQLSIFDIIFGTEEEE